MKAFVYSLVLCAAAAGVWAQALWVSTPPQPVHPMSLSTAKRIVVRATPALAPTGLQQQISFPLYDATSDEQIAFDGTYVYVAGPPSGTVFREQLPLLGPARLDALEILYSAGGAAGSTAIANIQVYGCLSGSVGDDPVSSGFPLIATFSGNIPTDGVYILTLDLGGVVYNAGNDSNGRAYAHDLVVQATFTGNNLPAFYIANGANSLGLRNDGGRAWEKPSLFPLGAGQFFNDEGNRLHYERYFIGTSDNNWRQGTGTYWWGGSPLGNFSISVYGSYNFIGTVSNNAEVDMTEAKLQIDGHPVIVPLQLTEEGVRAFTLPLKPNVAHDVRIVMGPPYLVRAKTVTASSPATPVVEDFMLISGDLDGDNEVTLFDFGILVRSFGEIGD